MGIDDNERRMSLLAGGLAIVLAAIFTPHLMHNTWITDTAKLSKTRACVAPYQLVNHVCQYRHLVHPTYYLPQFVLILVGGLAILFFARIRKRVGVAFTSFLLGLAMGTAGLIYLFLGGWLLIRALRLQKYGDASFSGSSRLARESARTKRTERSSGRSSTRSRSGKSDVASKQVKAPPSPSKRYTPKQRPRKR